MGIAALAAVGLVITLGVLSLLSGGLHFLFARPKVHILKSEEGENGFAFGLSWDSSREPCKYDKVKVRLFNPFGTPTQVEVAKKFDTASSTFARDMDMGPGLADIVNASGLDNATILVEVTSNAGTTHLQEFKANDFLERFRLARETASEFNSTHEIVKEKPLYTTVQRNFISEPLPQSNKALKLATNPEFAGEFSSAGGGSAEAQENFSVSKVWIDPGCIVCDACEAIYPEVFEVTDDTCIIRPGAPLDDGLLIQEAAEACPVEVIKFNKA
tara:strand:- start:4814 stop:5629 length:816 start_codon:yes stop_codon:yes gene_type:complete